MDPSGIVYDKPFSGHSIWRRISANIFPVLIIFRVNSPNKLPPQLRIIKNLPIFWKIYQKFFWNVCDLFWNFLWILLIFNWFKVIGLVTFDTRLGSLLPGLTVDSCPNKLIQAASDTNSEILRTDNGLQFWRKWNTPAFKKISRSQEYFERYWNRLR